MTDNSDELTAVYMVGLHDGRKSSQRTWVGLTDEEIEALAKWADKNAAPWHLEFARAIEAKLKEKNHG